jgi:hypothetical protein
VGATETVDSTRDHVGGVLETNLGEQDNELNIITANSPPGRRSSPCPPRSPASTARTCPTRLLPTGGFVTSAVLIAVGVGVGVGGLYTLMRRRGWL